MQGLRTQESGKFNKFWELVQQKAKEQNCIFFADCGEGKNFATDDMECENMCGWLIPLEKVHEFEKAWQKWDVQDKWSDFISFAEWEDNSGAITIEFKTY